MTPLPLNPTLGTQMCSYAGTYLCPAHITG